MKIKNIFKELLFLFFGLTSGIIGMSQEVFEHQYLVKVGDEAPDFETLLSDGSSFRLSENRDKVVMLQFTASWCSVCRKEMPYIESDIWNELQDEDFIVIGLDYKEDAEKVMAFAKDMNITYLLGLDETGEIFHKYALEGAGVTRNIIIDKSGKIIFLTRLFEKKEFDAMKKVIFKEVRSQ